METLPVILHGKGNTRVKTYALLDSGSTMTIMSKDLFLSLGVEKSPVEYTIRTISNDVPQGQQYEGVVAVSSLDETEQVKVKVTTVDNLPLNNSGVMERVSQWEHLKNIKVDAIPTNLIGILIGSDCTELRWTLEEVRGGRGEPYARKTLLGWTISGPARKQNLDAWKPSARQPRTEDQETRSEMDREVRHISRSSNQRDVYVLAIDELERQPRRQSNADFRDLNRVKREVMSQDAVSAVKDRTSTIQKVKDKHKSPRPLKIDPVTSPRDRRCAEASPRSLVRKFAVDTKRRDQDSAMMTKHIADRRAKRLKAPELNVDKRQWYFLHHPVARLSDPPKRPSPRSGLGTPTMGLQALRLKASRK